MNCGNRILQLTNYSIGSIPTATLLPLGIVTRKLARESLCKDTFNVSTSANNVVYINEPGFYKIVYNASLTAAAAGSLIVNLQLNGVTVSSATVTAAAAGTYNISISFETRVFCNCCANTTNVPVLLGLVNNGVALTGGSGNLIITRNGN